METLEKTHKTVERPTFKAQYEHFIGGEWVKPANGEYFDNISPVDGKAFTKAARGTKEDINKAIDAAHKAFETWSKNLCSSKSQMYC